MPASATHRTFFHDSVSLVTITNFPFPISLSLLPHHPSIVVWVIQHFL
jgi:hypothetical protein